MAGEPDSVAQVRWWVTGILRTAGYGICLVETAALVTSELITNALKHTASGHPDGTVRVELLTGACWVRVSVTDAGTEESEPTVPRSCPVSDFPEAARGLYLVDQRAERIGVPGDARGRIVFADIATPTSPDEAGNETLLVRLPKRTVHTRTVDNPRGGFS
ncbi:histidine kinase-like protein [Haloactinospora alba]|uniref:Histidine kinase-like protein n=1 Tax=Haloactinospora alba TaxID=405555 RepID=A0A543NEN4_9ACTN|nr:ATP-binding protein [Haloactinospora alba]TQN30276.1 histidine kinase-like protein [Haloactinospora alba]